MQIARNWAKADAKVQLFFIPSKFFEDFFQYLTKVFGIIDKTKDPHLIYIDKAWIFYAIFFQILLSLTQDAEQINEEVDKVKIERQRTHQSELLRSLTSIGSHLQHILDLL